MIEHRVEIPKVKDIFPDVSGFFSHVDYNLPMPSSQLDILLLSDYGLRSVAPLVSMTLGSKTTLSQLDLTLLANTFLNMYKPKWDRYMAIMEAEYDPIHNYLDEYQEHRDEIRDEDRVETKQLVTTDNESGTSSNTRTDNLSESNSYNDSTNGSNSGHNDRYGLNSSSATGVTTDGETNNSQSSGSSTRGNTGTQSNSGTNSSNRTINEGGTDSFQHDANNDYDKEGYHRGNIGNISTQKLIREEIDLWKWNFARSILEDARDFLTLPLYII